MDVKCILCFEDAQLVIDSKVPETKDSRLASLVFAEGIV